MPSRSPLPGFVREWVDEPFKRVALRARFLAPYRRLRFHEFGKRSIVHRPQWVYGPGQISIGEGTVVMSHSSLSVERVAWDRPAPVLRIGNGVWVRPFC